jgi:hypothetical protein
VGVATPAATIITSMPVMTEATRIAVIPVRMAEMQAAMVIREQEIPVEMVEEVAMVAVEVAGDAEAAAAGEDSHPKLKMPGIGTANEFAGLRFFRAKR